MYDVVIAGAGPVGLMLAAELRLAGSSVLVVEKDASPDQPYKRGAMGARSLNAPSVAALQLRGLLPAVRRAALFWYESAAAQSAPRPTFAGHFAGLPVLADRLDQSDPALESAVDAGGSGVISLFVLERLLAEHAEGAGVRICRDCALTGLEVDADGVSVALPGETIRASWLVGCDGGRSTVRKLAGFDFPGVDPEFTGRQAIVDIADPDEALRRGASGWQRTEHGSYVVGGWGSQSGPPRIHTVEYGPAPAERDAPPTAEELQASLRRVSGTHASITGVHVATRYTDRTRQAGSYRAGRVLLAGDAAHVHSPAGGQGLNLGLGDAVNLGWKLAATLHGCAPAGLLDTYTGERHPVGARVQAWSMAQSALGRTDARTQALRGVVADLLDAPAGATYVLKVIGGLDQRLELPGDHPLIGRPAPDLALAEGDTLTDHTRVPTAVLVEVDGQNRPADPTGVADCWGDRLRRVTARSTPRLLGARAALIRPDGYISWATNGEPTPAGMRAAIGALLGPAEPVGPPAA